MHATIRESSTLAESVTGIRRTGRGLAALRDRYIRRAEYLCMDAEFRKRIESARREWQEWYPRHPINLAPDGEPYIYPWSRTSEMEFEAWYPAWIQWGDIPLDLSKISLIDDWWELLRRLEGQAFPMKDFYSTTPGYKQPATRFIRACLQYDPRTLIGNVGQYFSLDRLELKMDRREYDEFSIEPEEWELSHVSQTWYIPVYPGMTERDLRDAIPGIIQQVQEVLGPRTVGARIEALRDDGFTQQAIADRLGLNVKAVQAHLHSCRKAA